LISRPARAGCSSANAITPDRKSFFTPILYS
jgi:hypothetical protein